ncbi:MAG: hypothetical protein LBK54_10455 [Propionibacteriaceae bacterium]|nr:hypothetical protein [Propionibacteriaceae bacterium]
MAIIQHVDGGRSAAALADLLNGDSRRRPVVVVTISAGQAAPWIDVEEIVDEAGDLADVYLIPTGDLTWEFSRRMAKGTQVYGGAGRVYPVGHEWVSDLTKSPLHFAFNAADGKRVTRQLISDALRMANAGGLLRSLPPRERRQISGPVKMVVAGRALVGVGNPLPAVIAEELTLADVPIERILTVGQQIEGWYDAATNRIDITDNLRDAPEALTGYAVGDVVLTRVALVESDRADLTLYPQTKTPAVTTTVCREDVTSNPADDLRTLMTVGEVIPARLVSTGPDWSLVLSDVDDDELVVSAPALLDGGPPWLVEDVEEDEESVAAEPAALVLPAPPLPSPVPEPVSEEAGPAVPDPVRPRPSPVLLDRKRRPAPVPPGPSDLAPSAPPVPTPPGPPVPTPPGPPDLAPSAPPVPTPPDPPGLAPTGLPARPDVPSPATESTRLLLRIDELSAEVADLKRDQESLRAQLLGGADERAQLSYLLGQAERRANRAENDLKAARSRLRKASNAKSSTKASPGPQFADAEQGFRYLVLTQWATRTLPDEQRERPLPPYIVGPRFLDSLDRLEGIKPEKVADVVFEIVTGLVRSIPGREVHHLRPEMGRKDVFRVRDDGAVAWRASLQVKSPSARRIHYWTLPNGRIELARVTTHDDYDA